MGLDVELQALPADCTLLLRAQQDPGYGEYLQFFRQYATCSPAEQASFDREPLLAEFTRDAKALAAQHPGLTNRYLYLGRYWGMLEYLLSDRRRSRKKPDESDWAWQAINGGPKLTGPVPSTIGIPLRFLDPDGVQFIALALSEVTSESLRRHWNPTEMRWMNVYKMPYQAGDAQLEYLDALFKQLQEFYTAAAEHGEGVLTSVN